VPAQKNLIAALLTDHFAPTAVDDLAITERLFPFRIRADLQRAADEFVAGVTVHHFCGTRQPLPTGLMDVLGGNPAVPALAGPPQHEEIDIGEDEPVRCLKDGFWLVEDGGTRFALLFQADSNFFAARGAQFQLVTAGGEAGARVAQKLFGHLERAVAQARCYRGKVLSLENGSPYMGMRVGIKVHRLRQVGRDEVILPAQTLEMLERNVIRFVAQRPRLAELGLSTKKGLLFHGPPGAGKTHTIQYLARALPGMTTLLITSEQVVLLDEYLTLARLLQPSMVVLEDVDLVGVERGTGGVWEQVMLHRLLNEMDGLQEEAEILFLLTTNRPEVLEQALAARPGRIDQAIEFPLPDRDGRAKLIRLYAKGAAVSEDLVRATAGKTDEVSPAFLKELMRRAIQFRLERAGAGELQQEDVDSALGELLTGGGSLNRKLFGFKTK